MVSRGQFQPIRLRKQQRIQRFRHGWISIMLVIFVVFFIIVGLPSLFAALFHHTDGVNIKTWVHTSDASVEVRVYNMATNQVSTMSLNDYILGVLAAQFRPDTSLAALKAGAVACRTYVIHAKIARANTATLANQHSADVTDDPGLDLPFLTLPSINRQYGINTPVFLSKLDSAIESTDGLILTAEGKPILAFTTLVSPGRTRDAAAVVGTHVSYLTSISCPDDLAAPNRTHVFLFTNTFIANALHLPEVDISRLTISSVDKTGFVQTVMYGRTVWQGTRFAAALHLPSQKFTWIVKDDRLQIITDGVGSGLGMSLNEAAAMAKAGKSWTDILSTFYPGTERELDVDML